MNRINENDAELLRAFQKWQRKQLSQRELQSALSRWIAAQRQAKKGAELSLPLGEIASEESVLEKRLRTVAQRAVALSEIEVVRTSFASALENLGEVPQSSHRDNVWMRCGTTLSDDTFPQLSTWLSMKG